MFSDMIWRLCLLSAAGALGAVHAGPLRDPRKAAPREEVNLLMFGVIQFSESLNYVYKTTEAKLAKICQTLESQAGTLQRLGKQAETAADVGRLMKQVIDLLQAQMVEQEAHTKMTRELVSGVDREEEKLSTKVKSLEMYLDHSVPPNIKELQERAEEHSEILRGLQDLIEFQKEIIETQNEQISKLQEMSEDVSLSFSDSPPL